MVFFAFLLLGWRRIDGSIPTDLARFSTTQSAPSIVEHDQQLTAGDTKDTRNKHL